MAEKLFDRLLTVVSILAGIGFLGLVVYVEVSHGGLTPRRFAAVWSVLYVFAVTLGFKGNLETHKDRLRGFAIEWVIACLVGLLLGAVLLIFG
jgi:hypothetical protein